MYCLCLLLCCMYTDVIMHFFLLFSLPCSYWLCGNTLPRMSIERHCDTWTGGHQIGFQITHVSSNCCSANMDPCSWICFRFSAAFIESTHWCFVLSRSWRCCSSGFFMSLKSALASWPIPTEYICLIFSLMSFSRRSSLLRLDSCRASFHCSHMSHAMFHNFLISSKVQCWLDFLDRSRFHTWSCCALHS